MSATATTTGGCFCGAVGFSLTGALSPATRCHCSLCRKRFGGAGSAFSRVRPGQFGWTHGRDALVRYGERFGLGFCGVCGSTLVGFLGEDVLGVDIGCLDGDPDIALGEHIFVDSKPSWHVIGGAAPQHPEWPG
jgi:hypothetical protein